MHVDLDINTDLSKIGLNNLNRRHLGAFVQGIQRQSQSALPGFFQ